jgi:hypothetical protein
MPCSQSLQSRVTSVGWVIRRGHPWLCLYSFNMVLPKGSIFNCHYRFDAVHVRSIIVSIQANNYILQTHDYYGKINELHVTNSFSFQPIQFCFSLSCVLTLNLKLCKPYNLIFLLLVACAARLFLFRLNIINI